MPLPTEEEALQPGINDSATFLVTVIIVMLVYLLIRYFQRKT